MDKNLKHAEIHRLASVELNLLNYSRSLPPTVLENARLNAGTSVYDPNGEVLFVRFPFLQNGISSGYADIAAHTALGTPLLAVAPAAIWNEQKGRAEDDEVSKSGLGDEKKRFAHYEVAAEVKIERTRFSRCLHGAAQLAPHERRESVFRKGMCISMATSGKGGTGKT